MILVDANLLLYAYDRSSPHHEAAREWLEGALNGVKPIRFAWVTLLAFLRISTDSRALTRPLSMEDSKKAVREWFQQPCVDVLDPSEKHFSILSDVLERGQARGPLVMDAHLAALAMEHGAVLHSTDRDFSRFPGLDWVNPLEGAGETPPNRRSQSNRQ